MAVQKLSFRLPLFTSRQFSVSSSSLRYKRAIMRREERKRRIKFYLPKKKSTISGKILDGHKTHISIILLRHDKDRLETMWPSITNHPS